MLTPAQKSKLIAAKLRILDLLLTNTHSLLGLTSDQSQKLETSFNSLIANADTLDILANAFPEKSDPNPELQKRFDAQTTQIEESFTKLINIIFRALPNDNKDQLKTEFTELFLTEDVIETAANKTMSQDISEAQANNSSTSTTKKPSLIGISKELTEHLKALKKENIFYIDAEIGKIELNFNTYLSKLVPSPTFNPSYTPRAIKAFEAENPQDFEQSFLAQYGNELKQLIGDQKQETRDKGNLLLKNKAKQLIKNNNIAGLAHLIYPHNGNTKQLNDIFALLTESQKFELLTCLLSKEEPTTFFRGASVSSTLTGHIKSQHETEFEAFAEKIKKLALTSFSQRKIKITENSSGDNKQYVIDQESNLVAIVGELIAKLTTEQHPSYVQNICQAILKALQQSQLSEEPKNKPTSYLSIYLLTKFISFILYGIGNNQTSSLDSNQKQLFIVLSKIIQFLANPTEETIKKHSDLPSSLLKTLSSAFTKAIETYLLETAKPTNDSKSHDTAEAKIDLTPQPLATNDHNFNTTLERKTVFLAYNETFLEYQHKLHQLPITHTPNQTLSIDTQLEVISPESPLEFRKKILGLIKPHREKSAQIQKELLMQMDTLFNRLKEATTIENATDRMSVVMDLKQHQLQAAQQATETEKKLIDLYNNTGSLQLCYEKLKYSFTDETRRTLESTMQKSVLEKMFLALQNTYRETSGDNTIQDELKTLSSETLDLFHRIVFKTYTDIETQKEASIKTITLTKETKILGLRTATPPADNKPLDNDTEKQRIEADARLEIVKVEKSAGEKRAKLEPLFDLITKFQVSYNKFLATEPSEEPMANNNAPTNTATAPLPPGSAAAVAISSSIFNNPPSLRLRPTPSGTVPEEIAKQLQESETDENGDIDILDPNQNGDQARSLPTLANTNG